MPTLSQEPVGKRPVNAYFEIRNIYISSSTFTPSASRTQVSLDRSQYGCEFIARDNDGTRYKWSIQPQPRLFQTRRLFVHVYPTTMRDFRIMNRGPSHIFCVTFPDAQAQAPTSGESYAPWICTQRITVPNEGIIELGVEVMYKIYGVNDFLSQNTTLSWTTNDYILSASSALEVMNNMRGTLEDLGQKAAVVLNIGEGIMSVVKDIHPIAALVVAALSIPMKMLRNKANYGEKARELCEQAQNTAKDLKALEGIEEVDDLLFESLVILLGGLIDACEALQAYAEAGTTKRTIRAQYDDTFQDSTDKLQEYNAQLQKRIVIYLAMKRKHDDDLKILSTFLKPVESSVPHANCHPGTRQSYLHAVDEWLNDPALSSKTLWLTGSPGAGKSTIASTICSSYAKCSSALLQFFFQGTSKKGLQSPLSVWPTMAWSLAHVHSKICSSLVSIARNERVIFSDMREQFTALIVGPLVENMALFAEKPCIFLIDALDEGMHHDHQVWSRFLETLSMFDRSLSTVNCRLIVTSRDLLDISDYISACSHRIHLSVGPDHAQEGSEEWQDIYTVLSAQLGSASDCFNPLSDDTLRDISDSASGLFVWAATAIKYVRKGRQIYSSRVPHLLSCFEDDPESGLPGVAMSKIYTQVLTTAFQNLQHEAERKAVRLFLSLTYMTAPTLMDLDETAKVDPCLSPLNAQLIGDILPLLHSEGNPRLYTLSHHSVAEFVLICMQKHEFGLSFQESGRILLAQGNRQLLVSAVERMNSIKLFKGFVQDIESVLKFASQVDFGIIPETVNMIAMRFNVARDCAICINCGDEFVAAGVEALQSHYELVSAFQPFFPDEEICVLESAKSPDRLTVLPDSLRNQITDLVGILDDAGQVNEQDFSDAPRWTRQKEAVIQGQTLLARLEEELCLYKFDDYQ